MSSEIVSFDDEKLILVDEYDNVTGFKDKIECHLGSGILHRAFSVILFNDKNEVLLQKRAHDKMLWGGFWSNTVCSHPRKGETVETATIRRLKEELGIEAELQFLYKFIYQAQFGDIGSEYENCHVFAGKYNGDVTPNPTEIESTEWVDADILSEKLHKEKEKFTPWFRMEWERINNDFKTVIESL